MIATNNFLRKISTRWRNSPTSIHWREPGRISKTCGREREAKRGEARRGEARRGEARRSEAKEAKEANEANEAVLDTRALLGHWLPVAADLRVSKDSRSRLLSLLFFFASSSRSSPALLSSLSSPSSRFSFLLPLLKSVVSAICLNSGLNRYSLSIRESPINSFIIHLCQDMPRRSFSQRLLIIFANREVTITWVFWILSRQRWHVSRTASHTLFTLSSVSVN